MNRIISISCLFLAILYCQSNVQAQDAQKEDAKTQKVALREDGKLVGNVFSIASGEKSPVSAKMTLSADGIVIDTVKADAEGNFSFANVAPGSYQMFGYADGLVGGGTVAVMPSTSNVSPNVSVPLDTYADGSYDAYAGAPVQSFGDVSCGSGCGAGCSGGGGGGGLNARRLLLLTGATLGIVAIAGGFDGDSNSDNGYGGKPDASPTY